MGQVGRMPFGSGNETFEIRASCPRRVPHARLSILHAQSRARPEPQPPRGSAFTSVGYRFWSGGRPRVEIVVDREVPRDGCESHARRGSKTNTRRTYETGPVLFSQLSPRTCRTRFVATVPSRFPAAGTSRKPRNVRVLTAPVLWTRDVFVSSFDGQVRPPVGTSTSTSTRRDLKTWVCFVLN